MAMFVLAAMTKLDTAASTTTPVSYGAVDVANLPLLLPFQIRNPTESALITALMNEQHASETLVAAMKREETLRTELQKAASSSLDDKNENANTVNRNASSSSSPASGVCAKATKKTGCGGNATANNSKKKGKSAKTVVLMKTIQNQIQVQQHVVTQCQQNLASASNWTRAMVQAEYSKRAVVLDPESQQYRDLEEAYLFFSARVGKNDGVPTDEPDEFYHELRIAYVKEMLPVMKKVGSRGDTTRESIAALPYVRQFQCDVRLLHAFRDELHQLAIAQGLRARFNQNRDPVKSKILHLVEEVRRRKEAETSELVRKWYRRRSVKLHPDKNGEQMRPAFEEFTDAGNVLSKIKLRQNYLSNMLDLTYFYRTANLPPEGMAGNLLECHALWNRRNRPDKVEESVKKDTNGKIEKTLQLEGGLHHQMPKGVVWRQRYERDITCSRSTKAVVSISIHALSPINDFYSRVRSVCVELRSADNETHTFRLNRADIVKTIRMDKQVPILASEIPVIDKSLNPGNWEVFWFAELDSIGTDPLNPQNATNEVVFTRCSAVRSFDIVDHNRVCLIQSFDQAERNCKVAKGELSSILHKIRRNQTESIPGRTPLSPFELSMERYGLYHQTLVRARKKCHALTEITTKLGRKSTVCDELSVLLSQSRQVFSEIEVAVVANKQRREKKVDIKRFKSYIASILEGDDPIAWIKNLTSEKLSCEGGDVNKLYQLFIEGKGHLALMFDSEVFKEASLREDLFSAKQRKDLSAKGNETAAAEAKEEEEANAAEAKRQAEEAECEKLREERELSEKWSIVGRYATIHGLTSEEGKLLNKKLAEIIYFHVDKDRFEVGLYKSNKKVLLKRNNLTVHYGPASQPKPPLQVQSSNKNVVLAVQQPQPSSTPKDNPALSVANESMESVRNPNESKLKESTADKNAKENFPPAVPQGNIINYDAAKMKTTIYVRAAHSKKLTGKRGRKKEALVKKSGVADIHVAISAIGSQVPVNLIGTYEANCKAVVLIQEEVGVENVSEKFDKQPPSTPLSETRSSAPPPSAVLSPAPSTPVPTPPTSIPPTISSVAVLASAVSVSPPPGLVRKMSTLVANSYQSIATSFFANNFANGGVNHVPGNSGNGVASDGAHHVVPISLSESEPASRFEDALLPFMDLSLSTPTKLLQREVPAEIGIRSQVTRETITVTDSGDRSSTSNATYNSSLNENDPLLMFLRSNHQCIKGNIEEFYIWLVKSEDIDSMSALKEAVSDEEYLADSMKVGCGTSGLKGFKRKTFQRAVMEYREVINKQQAGEILSPKHDTWSPSSVSVNGNFLLPANLFSDFDVEH